MADVFISYNSNDQEKATSLVTTLEKSGTSCWIANRDVPKGEPYDDYIPDAIAECGIVVMLFSKTSLGSPHVKKELRLAVKHNKKVIPYMLEDVDLREAFEYHIESNTRIQAYGGRDKAVQDLINSIKREFRNPPRKTKVYSEHQEERNVSRVSDIYDVRCGENRTPVKLTKDGQYQILCMHCEKELLSDKKYKEANQKIEEIEKKFREGAFPFCALAAIFSLLLFSAAVRDGQTFIALTIVNPFAWLFLMSCLIVSGKKKVSKIRKEVKRNKPEYGEETLKQMLYCEACAQIFTAEIPIDERKNYFYVDSDTKDKRRIQ